MIDTEQDNRKMVERAFLVGVREGDEPMADALYHLRELRELVDSLGVPVVGEAIAPLKEPRPKFLLGAGKAEEMVAAANEVEADCMVFDGELHPSQQRNWERLAKMCVIDRQEVILDIFGNRASTREASLQIDLARLQYMLPRLARAWTHLSRQKGGAKGTRGEGEQQIEVDRRIVQQKIAHLRGQLGEVRRHRGTQRKSRMRGGVPQAAIVGYTNAGKSSLLNALAGSDALVEDKLFATLDPTTRKILLPNNQELLLTDTVGFVRKLPHLLVEAFKATLEEAVMADFLIHVVDVNSERADENWQTTLAVLEELGSIDKPMLTVFNKIDTGFDRPAAARFRHSYPGCVFVSTKTREGFDSLRTALVRMADRGRGAMRLRLPPSRHDIVALAHSQAEVLSLDYDEAGGIDLVLSVDAARRNLFAEFAAADSAPPLGVVR